MVDTLVLPMMDPCRPLQQVYRIELQVICDIHSLYAEPEIFDEDFNTFHFI